MEDDSSAEDIRYMNSQHQVEPPAWMTRLLDSFCPDYLFEEIEGDLYQRFQKDIQNFGIRRARYRYVWNAIRFFRPGVILRNKLRLELIEGSMIRNYLLIAFRNFRKQKSFTVLNIVGLSIGMVASLLILQYVKYERSYDSFHQQADNIYRIQYNGYQGGELRFECAAAVPAIGPALQDNFPEVKRFTRLFPVSGVISYESPEHGLISFLEEKMQITDSSIFEIFDFKLLKGNPEQVLAGPNKAVISSRAAKKYFGDADPIGKTIAWNGNRKFEVTGIFQDIPANSHIKFDFMLSYQTLDNETNNQSQTAWWWYDFNTYVLLQPGTDVKLLQKKWDAYLEQTRGEEWRKTNHRQEFILQPMTDIHLYANLLQESQPEESGDGDSVYALTCIAIFILVIAWVNYINLATAKAMDRANEVGVRKVMGAEKRQLIAQFFAESFLINLFSALMAIGSVRLAWPFFSQLSGRDIPLSYLMQSDFWLLLLLLFTVGSLLSGFYPAIVLSSFKPVAVLKGKVFKASQGGVLRKSLVVFQFVASVILISGSMIVYQQLKYMQEQDLGVDISETLVVKAPGVADSTFAEKLKSFKAEASQIAGVKAVSASTNVPGDEIFWASGIRQLARGQETSIAGYTVGIDEDYVPAFGLKMVAGRSFDRDFTNERENVLLNESMSVALGFASPEKAVGEKVVQGGGDTLQIVGVIGNYHQMSLKEAVTPLVFRYTPSSAAFIAFKLEDQQQGADILGAIQEPWKTFFPGNPIDHFYLDQFFNRQYRSEKQFGQIFTLFTILAIFIACLGLFGLASFMTSQRTKEIGIRKALGSSPSNIVLLLSKGFIQLVVIANIIAWPLAWWLMSRWLESFPFRIDINPFLFILAGLGVVLIAFISVSLQTLKAALINPAKTLKYE